MGFSRQGYWSGLPFPSPEDLPDPGIKPGSPILQADALLSEPPGKSNAPIRKNETELYTDTNYLYRHIVMQKVRYRAV